MEVFELSETVICSCTVKSGSVLTDPATSMKITITDPSGVAAVSDTAMTKDSTGAYHYNYTPATLAGIYTVTYVATNGTKVSKAKDHFQVRSQL
jgi:hypothetical protein